MERWFVLGKDQEVFEDGNHEVVLGVGAKKE